MGNVVRFPDPIYELYHARRVRMDASALDLSRALDRLQHSREAEDIVRCRLIRKELARQSPPPDQRQYRALTADELADIGLPPVKSQQQIDGEAETLPAFGFWAVLVCAVVAGGVGLGWWVQSLWLGGV